MLNLHAFTRSARNVLIALVCLGCVFASAGLQAQRALTIVSVGDSVASGEGNPDVPQVIEPNLAFNPLDHTPDLAYDPFPEPPNLDYDPDLTIPNPAFEPGILIGENWGVRLEESLLIQGDENGTAHPNLKGHEVYRDRLVEEILAVGLETIIPCPGITAVELLGPTIQFTLSSEHPVESLELQSTSDLRNPVWGSEAVGLTDLGNSQLETAMPVGSESPKYFRLVVRP